MRKLLFSLAIVAVAAIWVEPLITAMAGRWSSGIKSPDARLLATASPPATTNPAEPLAPTPSAAVERPTDASLARYREIAESLRFLPALPSLPTTVLGSGPGHSQARATVAPSPAEPVTTTKTAPQTRPLPQWDKLRGTDGYWRLGKTTQGVWWFISPQGNPEFMNMVTTVQPYQLSRDPMGAHFVSRDFTGDEANPGDLTPWARQTMQRVLDAGFKGIGAWSHRVFHDMPIAMTRDLNVWAAAPKQAFRLYHPDWLPAADAHIQSQVQPLRKNRYLVGYFIDNELDFSDISVGPGAYFNFLPAEDPNRVEVVKVIRELWPEIAEFNAAWHCDLKDYAALDQWKEIPRVPEESYAALRSRWLEHLMGDYFRQVTQLIHKHDPNHLVLGIRFAGFAPSEVVRAARPWTDAQSINYYVGDARLDPTIFNALHEQSDQPVIVSEYSFHALDGRSGNRNTAGFAAQVVNQQARAEAYRLMTTRLARVPYIVGADWFQWSDEPPSGRSADGEDVNFGVVDVDDRPYNQLVDAIRQTAARLDTIHATSAQDQQDGVWRDSPTRPTMRVAYLSRPIRLDGDLSEWPDANRVQGIHLSQTVGLDVSRLPPPTIMLGWRPEGLYLAMDVPNPYPMTAPITARWWTRDCVEFWFATRPVHQLETTYNEYCHQFFFVPLDPAVNNGIAGAVGQWHRPGDALKDHLLPHPDIRYCCRLLGDRYVVEMFIPKGSLNGFDPANHSQLAFNIATRNYQQAANWYWSTSKEVHTQNRPTTWGDIRLLPPGVSAIPAPPARTKMN